ncbi:ADP-ribosylglycohydrolase family protein [Lachnospiraceae bacterium LCP25S3_G4]
MRYDNVLGCLIGAACGDAMGAATETKSTKQIEMTFGGRVEEFKKPPMDTLARGREKGQITDAFSIPYYLTNEIIKEHGLMTKEVGISALKTWGKTEYFQPFAGMTTRKVVNELNQDKELGTWAFAGRLGTKLYKSHYYALSSNGAAVKAYPIGLFHAGKLEKTIRDTVEITMASHDDPYSISGACAVSAGICEAAKTNASVQRVVDAAMEGAKKGEYLARKREDIWDYPGPSVVKRMEMAIQTSLHVSEQTNAMENLRDIIGSGPAIAETVPTAFGLIIANADQPLNAIFDAVNIGDETSAIASIVGALVGTLYGTEIFPKEYLIELENANSLNLQEQARNIMSVWESLGR